MESLPDELFPLIFKYLYRFNIIYSFNNLNERFQRMTQPYLYQLELNQKDDISLIHLQLFLIRLLPTQASMIRSIMFEGDKNLFRLFHLNISYMNNLESLSLHVVDEWLSEIEHTELPSFLRKTLALPCLNELSLHSGDTYTLDAIVQYKSPNLVKLSVLYCFKELITSLYWSDALMFLSLKTLTLSSDSGIENLYNILKVTPNLEELNVPIYYYQGNVISRLELPKSLVKLQLKIEHTNEGTKFHQVKSILQMFGESDLKTITLHIGNADQELVSDMDHFHSLVENFRNLQKFHYCIHSRHQPDHRFSNIKRTENDEYSDEYDFIICTDPKPQFVDSHHHVHNASSVRLHPRISVKKLLKCETLEVPSNTYQQSPMDGSYSLRTSDRSWDNRMDSGFKNLMNSIREKRHSDKYLNLKKIYFEPCIEDVTDVQFQLLNYLICHAPFLNTISIDSYNTSKIIQKLRLILASSNPIKNIAQFELTMTRKYTCDCHSEFLSDLSKIFPHLISLTLPCFQDFEQLNIPVLTTFIEDLKVRQYFSKLAHLKLQLRMNEENCAQFYQQQRRQQQQTIIDNRRGPLIYAIGQTEDRYNRTQYYYLNIWF